MLKLLAAIAVLALAIFVAYDRRGLAIFNALAPQDAGGKLLAQNLHFGPHPRQTVDVYVPETAGPHPVLVFVHGGSWASGSKDDYGFVGRAFAARGYVAVLSEYRLVPEVKYPGFVDDTAAAITFASENAPSWGGDPQKLFVVGHSAGAYNAVQAVFRRKLEQKVRAMVGMSGPYDFLPLDDVASINAFSGVPDLPESQPVNQDLSQAPPLLMLHGAADTRVGVYHARHLAAKYRDAGRVVDVKIYPGVSHAGTLLSLSKPLRGTSSALDDIDGFFHKYF
ncbi:MAG: alpha/beta hydrolase [Hyphomicrobiales bacterium]